ncbi:phosphoglycerate dehydrogenase [Caldinitratiruptor microaerophilus]|uniref:D-3-phosphoglycerate dehydrogenase n=1 Tax=Caldinitratiruptor microaerophilus TaxID=671077 RepID=A0AA35CNT9_9FIRM|nr:phosphoglycerate dehydrogenase [Caldinitratiruptor microaerophilus]BDG61883.1 D-3-phosphoglycerate dehydrogenase [Caldinitratiruptor microaerophilus]
MRILVADPIAEAGIRILQEQADVDVRRVTPAELLEIASEYDAIITRSETKITADVLARATRLKVVGRAGVGVDNIDVAAATERGVVVVNVPGANTFSTAEHTWALILALVRNVPQAMASLKAGEWDRRRFTGVELHGKTLGVIGFGRIGYEVAARGRAFGMRVLAYDPYANPARAEHLGVLLVDLPVLLAESDIVTIHAAKTPETARLIQARELAMMKKGARIVNCARGGMVDEMALYEALRSGHLAGAALDVFSTEPLTEHPLFTLPNVVVTPHLAASTVEAQEANGVQIARQVLRVLAGELVPEAVNLPAVPPDAAQVVARHLPLAEVLGSFLGQAFAGPLRLVEVIYEGELAREPATLLTNTVLKGLLGTRASEVVNYINAPALAKRYDVGVRESRSVEGGQAEGRITVRAQVGPAERTVTGTLGRDGEVRLVRVNGMPLDLAPTRYMIVTRHHDRPGILGQFGTILGRAGVNIAGLSLGRQARAGEAVAIFLVDDAPGPEVVAELAAVDGVAEARPVTLPMLPNGLS